MHVILASLSGHVYVETFVVFILHASLNVLILLQMNVVMATKMFISLLYVCSMHAFVREHDSLMEQ